MITLRILLNKGYGDIMKKILCIAGIVFAIIGVIGFSVFVLIYTGVLSKKDLDTIDVYTYYTDTGLKYTEAEWSWAPIENKDTIHYTETITCGIIPVALNLDSNIFYNVTIPDVPIVYDFGKTIYAEDGSFMVRVIGDVNINNLSATAGIDNGTPVNQITIVNSDDTKGMRVIATLVDGSAIIATVYEGDEYYSILRDSLASNHDTYTVDNIPYSEQCQYLDTLKYEGSFAPQVIVGDITLAIKRYLFEDGYVWTQTSLDPYYKTKQIYLAKLNVISGQVIDTYYEDDTALFAKAGDFYLGVVNHNTNTSIVLIGKGEEAYCNIVSVIQLAK